MPKNKKKKTTNKKISQKASIDLPKWLAIALAAIIIIPLILMTVLVQQPSAPSTPINKQPSAIYTQTIVTKTAVKNESQLSILTKTPNLTPTYSPHSEYTPSITSTVNPTTPE